MFTSELSKLGNYAVLLLNVADLADGNFTQALYQKMTSLGVCGCALNLSGVTGLSETEWRRILEIAGGLQLLGINTALSGISPPLAAALVIYDAPNSIQSYLNEDEALSALANQE